MVQPKDNTLWMIKAGGSVVALVAVLIGIIFLLPLTDIHRIYAIRLVFVFVIEILLLVGYRYIWLSTKLVLDHQFPLFSSFRHYNLAFKLITVVIFVVSNLSFLSFFINSPNFFTVCFTCQAFSIQFIFFIFALNRIVQLYKFVSLLFRNNSCSRLSDKSRRTNYFLALLISVLLTIYGIHNAKKLPVVKRVDITLKDFPRSMDGFSVTLLSDIHFGITVGKDHLERLIPIVNSLDSDLISVVGDLTDLPVEEAENMAEPFQYFKSRLGKYFATGNHEYYTNSVDNWFHHLKTKLGFTILHNSHVMIENGEDFFYLAGVDDIEAGILKITGHGFNLDQAVGSCNRSHAIVLLAHQPKAAKMALDSNYNIQLVLSGHTHGGQMFPFSIPIYLTNPFYAGLYRYKSGQVYVTAGTVFWGFPLRTFSESEITYIVLHSENS